jgi:hypothetical protein
VFLDPLPENKALILKLQPKLMVHVTVYIDVDLVIFNVGRCRLLIVFKDSQWAII